jgi:hypothetical protein
MMAVVGYGSPVVIDMTQSHVEIAVKATIGSFVAHLQIFDPLVAATPQTARLNPPFFDPISRR